MPKTTVFELNATLKAGSHIYLKGMKFSEKELPLELKIEVDNNTGTIGVFSYGEDFEGSSFNSDETITFKEPKKKLVGRPRKKL